MPKVTRQCIDKIKNSVDVFDVISPYVSLKRCGSSWRGLSPFNHEKTPSFFVIPTKSMFKCFSSGYAGDIFRFLQLKENISFVESVEMIAHKFNIQLEYDNNDDDQHEANFSKKELFEINDLANSLFGENFFSQTENGKKIREYWQNTRKFSLDFAKKNGIGLSPNSESELLKLLTEKKFSFEAIKNSGLFYFKEGETNIFKFKLRFRMRMTIPIRDIQGRIVGFSARFIDGITPSGELSDAKYINSPETPIFHKGSLLFGINHARKFIDDSDEFWLVEGQIDAMRCWERGLNTAIAPQGTAITDTQLSILRRYSPNVNCLLDGDEAGLKAADRIIPMAFKAGLDLRVCALPSGHDPDIFFRDDFENRLKSLRDKSLSSIAFMMLRLLPFPEKVNGRQKADALQKIYEVILNSDSLVVQESCLNELSDLSKSDRQAIAADFKTFSDRIKFSEPMPAKFNVERVEAKKVDKKMLTAEEQILSIILAHRELAETIANVFSCDWLAENDNNISSLLIRVINEIQSGMLDSSMPIDMLFNVEDEKNLIYSLLVDFEDPDNIEDEINKCLKKIYSNFVRNKILKIDRQILKISLEDKDDLKILQTDRLHLREKLLRQPKIKLGTI